MMGDREVFVRRSVMEAIANDYEDFAMVCAEVSRWAAEAGLAVSRGEVEEALQQLIRDGYAQSYIYSPELGRFEATAYSPDRGDELWFYLNKRGKLLVAELG